METLILVSILNTLIFLVTIVAVVILTPDHKRFKRLFPVLLISCVLTSCRQEEIAPRGETESVFVGTYIGDLFIRLGGVSKGINPTTLILTRDSLSYDYQLEGKPYTEKGKYYVEKAVNMYYIKANGKTYETKVDSVTMTYLIRLNTQIDSKKYLFEFDLKKEQ
jgi:hypothetical protein